MKGYVLLFLLVVLALLLMPLSSFGALDEPSATANATTTTESTTTTVTATTATQPVSAPTASEFRVLDAASGNVIALPERDFLIGTLAAEMYPSFHPEALKAQAVAAFTYFSYERAAAREKGENADFSDVPDTFPALYTTAGMQARWGDKFEEYYQTLCGAVDAVYGRMILYDGKPILAVYHAMSTEQTETAAVMWGRDLPYLQSVKNGGDTALPTYESSVTVSAAEFAAALKAEGVTLEGVAAAWVDADSITRSPAGTVTAITIGGRTFTGREVRELFALRSAVFTVDYDPESGFCFTVHGYGHGVGMSQCGANELAKQGKTWQEILTYYYTNVTIV